MAAISRIESVARPNRQTNQQPRWLLSKPRNGHCPVNANADTEYYAQAYLTILQYLRQIMILDIMKHVNDFACIRDMPQLLSAVAP